MLTTLFPSLWSVGSLQVLSLLPCWKKCHLGMHDMTKLRSCSSLSDFLNFSWCILLNIRFFSLLPLLHFTIHFSFNINSSLFFVSLFLRGRKRYVSEGDGGAVKLPEN